MLGSKLLMYHGKEEMRKKEIGIVLGVFEAK